MALTGSCFMVTWTRFLNPPFGGKVAGHIPARISNVPSWDVETIFIYF
jgi:hypothetical protein